MKFVSLHRSSNPAKKFEVVLLSSEGRQHIVRFGATGSEDFTIHHDEARKASYIQRHKTRENWTRSGILTAGFWSRWLLWNQPTLASSLADIRRRFRI